MPSCDSYPNFVEVTNTSKKNLNENSRTAKAKATYKDLLRILENGASYTLSQSPSRIGVSSAVCGG